MYRIWVFINLLVGVTTAGAVQQKNAELIVLNKVSARSEVLQVPVGDAVLVGPFSLIVRICDKSPPEDPPESGAYLDVVQQGNTVFEGWMFASDPAINSMQHPVYDIWLKRCF